MADRSFSTGLLDSMDHLWFHHLILFSQPPLIKPIFLAAAAAAAASKSEKENTILEVNTSITTTTKKDNQFDEGEFKQETKLTESKSERDQRRPTRLNQISFCKSGRSYSSSPSSQKRSKNKRTNDRGGIRLQKTMSCKSLCELELEEVKGFMDLGFRFSKDHLSKRMMSLIPGLQRLEQFKPQEVAVVVDYNRTDDEQEEEEEEEERCHIVRPYLSESWLIKRPDSPLLNLRIPRVSTASDMKKHIKYWAKTVATAIQQES